MAPIKFEEDLKKKLEERTLQPSEASWHKLSKRLDADSDKRRFSKFWWLAVAALVVVMFQVGINTNSSDVPAVKQPVLVDEAKEHHPVEGMENSKQNHLPEAFDTAPVEEVTVKAKPEKPRILDEMKPSENQNFKLASAGSSKTKKSNMLESSDNKIMTAPEFTVSNNAVVTKTERDQLFKNIQQPEDYASVDKEIDSLLKAAQKAIIIDKTMSEASNATAVDAQNLLMEIETEVEPSLKSKVYKALKGGYQKVKTAVAERNN